jgi:hypothetical protein
MSAAPARAARLTAVPLALALGSVPVHAAPAVPWRLVGAYDAAAVGLARPAPDPEAEGAAALDAAMDFMWAPDPELVRACGLPRTPTGLGVMEAVAMATGLSPTLALVLRHEGRGAPAPLTTEDLVVSIVEMGKDIDDREPLVLRPAVEPRRIRVRLDADGVDPSHVEVVRTQLAIELCLEHKLGRAWSGGDRDRVRQAFLLQGPGPGLSEDRRYFVGQRDPVSAYLGPPDACLVGGPTGPAPAAAPSAELVPADVWDVQLRPCPAGEPAAPEVLPIASFGADPAPRASSAGWRELRVLLEAGAGAAPRVRVELDGEQISGLEDVALYPADGGARTDSQMEDLLGPVPHTYPLVSHDGAWYTVLLIPDWQLTEGLRRAARDRALGDMSAPLDRGPSGTWSGAAWVLRHPEALRVQLRPLGAEGLPAEVWPDLASPLQRGPGGARAWGYIAGMVGGRAPVFLPQAGPPAWEQVLLAQRADQQSGFLVGFLGLVVAIVAGLRRLPELWRPVPEERADYWPASNASAAANEAPPNPDPVQTEEGG